MNSETELHTPTAVGTPHTLRSKSLDIPGSYRNLPLQFSDYAKPVAAKHLSSPLAGAPIGCTEGLEDVPLDGPPKGTLRGPPGGPRGGPPGADEAEQHFKPKSLSFWLIMVSVFFALFLVALDRTILATAVPRITNDFNSQGDIGWYASSYMLTAAASQLLFGRIYKFYDLKWSFLSCITIFEAGSLICALAPNSIIFIIGRAVAGLGSAGIFTGSMMIMIPMVPLHKRPMFQSMFGMVFGISAVVGPLTGGGFTSHLNWRWCFWINLPIGAITVVVIVFLFRMPKKPKQPATLKQQILRLDPLGSFFLLPSVVSLLLALQWGGSKYPWDNWRIILLLVVFVVGFLCFASVQVMMPETATVPLRVISQRTICFAASFTFFLAGSMLIIVYYIPVWFQAVKRVDPVQSGIYTIPLVLSLVVSSVGSGAMTQKIGYYVPSMLIAPCIMATGEGLMSTFQPGSGSRQWITYQFLVGFGLGFGMQISGLAAQTVLPKGDVPTGVSIMFFVQQLGGAVFTSVGQTILSNILVSGLEGMKELHFPNILDEGVTDILALVEQQFPGDVDKVIDIYNYACTRIFLAGMGITFACLLCALGVEWRSIKDTQGPPGPGPGPKGAGDAKKDGKREESNNEKGERYDRIDSDNTGFEEGVIIAPAMAGSRRASHDTGRVSLIRKPVGGGPGATRSSLLAQEVV